MTISELIEALQNIKNVFGDMPVKFGSTEVKAAYVHTPNSQSEQRHVALSYSHPTVPLKR